MNEKPRDRPSRFVRIAGALVALSTVAAMATACGGGGDGVALADTATCTIERSELGPFGPETSLGESMDEATARAAMARDNVAEFLAISATGPWNDAWDTATDRVGGSIHVSLSWIDVDGELRDLFEDGDAFEFADLRVSRSFQGKIEHSTEPIYLPVPDDGRTVAEDPSCVITSIHVGDQNTQSYSELVGDIPVG